MDEIFEQAVARAGGELITSVEVEYDTAEFKKAPVYLTTARFGGTIVGFASHREANDVPIKNASRIALCNQNRGLSSDLFRNMEPFSKRERFVLIMVQRDQFSLGKLAGIRICVAASDLERFVTNEEIEDFIAGYGADGTEKKPRAFQIKPVNESFKASMAPATDGNSRNTTG